MEEISELLTKTCKLIQDEKKWTSVSRIVGEAAEDCIITLPCPICHQKSLTKYKTNEKSKDVMCKACSCQIQIKASKYRQNNTMPLKLMGAEYKTTCDSFKNNTIHYIVLLYSVSSEKYTIQDILFINHQDISESCIVPRNPLKPTAKRAGWQGCTLVFNVCRSIRLIS